MINAEFKKRSLLGIIWHTSIIFVSLIFFILSIFENLKIDFSKVYHRKNIV